MEALLFSTGVVALAEMGDKTQIATVALTAMFAVMGVLALLNVGGLL
jgi:putative Ca2+/H+ antiporter (TMEM165/GDT1 family)